MKKLKRYAVLFLCILLITGCSDKKSSGGKGVGTANSVDKVISDQINNENSKTETTESEEPAVNDELNEDTEDKTNSAEDGQTTEGGVDYDLTQMSSDMVYATVYQMMVAPKEYEGKTFRIDGKFYAAYYKPAKKYYFYCVIQDATACCSQGMEFVWEDGSHSYPDEYPKDNAKIVVEGTFETYREKGDKNLYCRLADATLQQKNKKSLREKINKKNQSN